MNLCTRQELWWQAVTGRAESASAAEGLRGTPALAAASGLRLYRSMYRSRIGQVLIGTYPELAEQLGQQSFRRLAMDYLDAYPSLDPRIEYVGRSMARYLDQQPDLALRRLARIAALEWARQAAMLAADPPTLVDLAACDPTLFATGRLQFIPSLSLVTCAAEARCAVWTDGQHLLEQILPGDEAEALECALRGGHVPEVCGAFSSALDPVRRAWIVLGGWSRRHWIVGIAPPRTGES